MPLLLDQVDRKQISLFVSARQRAGVANATIRRDLTALSSLFRAAKAWDWVDSNPAADYDRIVIRERRDPIPPPSNEDVEEMINRCGPMFGRLVRFLAQTGMRQQEAATLKWSQVDIERSELTIYKSKTDRPRVIKLSPEALGTLAGTPRHTEKPYIFWHDDGERFKNPASHFSKLCSGRHSGGKRRDLGFRCHDLRHKFAIDWLRQGGDIYALSRHLGHTSVKTTEIYLGHVSNDINGVPEQKPEQVQRSAIAAKPVSA